MSKNIKFVKDIKNENNFEFYDQNVQVLTVKLFNICKYYYPELTVDNLDKYYLLKRVKHYERLNKIKEYEEFIPYKILNIAEMIANNYDHLMETRYAEKFCKTLWRSEDVSFSNDDITTIRKLELYYHLSIFDETWYWFDYSSSDDYLGPALGWLFKLFQIYPNLKYEKDIITDYLKGNLYYCKNCTTYYNFDCNCDSPNKYSNNKYEEPIIYENLNVSKDSINKNKKAYHGFVSLRSRKGYGSLLKLKRRKPYL